MTVALLCNNNTEKSQVERTPGGCCVLLLLLLLQLEGGFALLPNLKDQNIIRECGKTPGTRT